MTAVATFPSVPRAGWPNSSQSTLNQMSPDEVARLFIPRKGSQRGAPQGSEGGGVWGNGQIRGGTAGHDVGQAGGVGNLKNKKTTRGAPWPQKGDMLRGPGIGTHSTSSSLSSSPTMNGIHQKTPILPSQHRGSQPSPLIGGDNSGTSFLMLLPLNNSFETKLIPLPYYPDTLRIGRQTNAKTLPNPTNGYFDSKVLSRQHAEVWAEPNTGKVWIRDVKSSNGTFVNGTRLSQENRDSEPHELRTDDVLELGIDIFSEDNKSIIHHKVAAKVEHAGFQNGQMNLELNNLGEMDPIMGGGLISPQLKQVNSNFARGRSASQNSRAGSVAGGGGAMMQRGAPVFIQSVSVEQIVKRLNSELHAAKQQAQELQRTQEFFDHLLNLEVVRKEPEIKKAEIVESAGQSPMIDSGVALDAGQFQNMSHHPLPPPAKHITVIPEVEKSELEEKPLVHDISPPSPVSPPLKRSPKNTMTEPPQHLFSLVAQLRDARLELEAKSMRVKDLEDLLRREREAREMAEAQLQMASHMATEADGTDNSEEDDIPDDVSVAGSDVTVVDVKDHVQSQENDIQSAAAATAAANAATEAAAMLQKKLEEMMAQLKAAQAEIETYKKRVKAAEEEGQQSKRTLMEMVAKIRADEEKRQKEMKEISVQTERKNADGSLRGKPVMVSCGVQAEIDQIEEDEGEVFPGAIANGTVKAVNGPLVIGGGKQLQNRHRDQEQQQQLQNLSTEMVKKAGEKRNMVKESVPYMSIVGVVVIGVSIMAILNNWQKGER